MKNPFLDQRLSSLLEEYHRIPSDQTINGMVVDEIISFIEERDIIGQKILKVTLDLYHEFLNDSKE